MKNNTNAREMEKLLKGLNPPPHPLKAVFKKHRIAQWKVARVLGISQPWVNLILNGFVIPSNEYEAKLKELAEQLEGNSDGLQNLRSKRKASKVQGPQ